MAPRLQLSYGFPHFLWIHDSELWQKHENPLRAMLEVGAHLESSLELNRGSVEEKKANAAVNPVKRKNALTMNNSQPTPPAGRISDQSTSSAATIGSLQIPCNAAKEGPFSALQQMFDAFQRRLDSFEVEMGLLQEENEELRSDMRSLQRESEELRSGTTGHSLWHELPPDGERTMRRERWSLQMQTSDISVANRSNHHSISSSNSTSLSSVVGDEVGYRIQRFTAAPFVLQEPSQIPHSTEARLSPHQFQDESQTMGDVRSSGLEQFGSLIAPDPEKTTPPRRWRVQQM
ncbi:hypothetical protein BT69DRAFT_1299815 [Atractiella rhizophila]|nr:hypothetical protein BT69DRAFT_1299815 [Atractiella rhizophila]